MRALTAVGSSIAHEMRTPLLGIRYDASGLQDYLPRLIDAHEWAVAHGWDGDPLEPAERERTGSRPGPHLASHGFRQYHDQYPAHEYRGAADRSRQLRQVLHGRRGHAANRQLSLQRIRPGEDRLETGERLHLLRLRPADAPRLHQSAEEWPESPGRSAPGSYRNLAGVGPAVQSGLLPRYRDRHRRRSATPPVRAVLHRPPRWDQSRHRAYLLPARDRKLRRHAHLPLGTRQIHRVRHQPAPNRSRAGRRRAYRVVTP